MSDQPNSMIPPELAASRVAASLAARRKSERRFRAYGRIAIFIALAFLVTLFVSIFSKGIPGFFQHYVTLEVTLDRAKLDPAGDQSAESLFNGDARGIIRAALYEATGASGRSGRKAAGKIISQGAEQRLRKAVLKDPSILDTTQSMRFAVDDVDSLLRGFISRDTPNPTPGQRQDNRLYQPVNSQWPDQLTFSDYLVGRFAQREMAVSMGHSLGRSRPCRSVLCWHFHS